jgi:hypothetical protein
MPTFFESISEKRFFSLLKLLHFVVSEAYGGQVPLNIYKMKPVFDHLVKFSESYVPENQVSIDENFLLWKGRLSLKLYIPNKSFHFGTVSYKLCEAKLGYVWNTF